MADQDKRRDHNQRSEIDKLLAEADLAMTGPERPVPLVPPQQEEGVGLGGLVGQLRAAALSAAVAASGVWLLFAVLPFLRATSGAVGALLATFVAVLVFRRGRRDR